ncbi:hypothetical protein [Novosphingobium sp. TH158]|nr:hypothetical protein [Novosphingobium sp. TH158]
MQSVKDRHYHEELYHGFVKGVGLFAAHALVIALIVIAIIS